MLEERNAYLLIDLENVNWYIKYMEDGKDPKYLMQEYFKQKEEIKLLNMQL